MLQYLYADELALMPKLQKTMFKDRADQFKTRLGWDVSVDADGFERDAYDALNPLYAIWCQADGRHGGSMRILPTTGPCMYNDHFSDIGGGVLSSPLIWESTRFCLAPDLGADAGRVSAAIMLAGCEVGLRFQLEHAIGVFDRRMIRIYRAIGWAPEVLGTTGKGRDAISVGLWDFSDQARRVLCTKAKVSPELSQLWIDRAFGATQDVAQSA